MAYHRSSSVLTSDMVQHEFTILKLNAKYIVSSGHKYLNTGITVIRFIVGVCVSATAYICIQDMV